MIRTLQQQFLSSNPSLDKIRLSTSATMHLLPSNMPQEPEDITCIKQIAKQQLLPSVIMMNAYDRHLRDEIDLFQQAFYAYVSQHLTVHCDSTCPFKTIHQQSLHGMFGRTLLTPYNLYDCIKPVYPEFQATPDDQQLSDQIIMDVMCSKINKRRQRLTGHHSKNYSTSLPLPPQHAVIPPLQLCRTWFEFILAATQAQQHIAIKCTTDIGDNQQQHILRFLRCYFIINSYKLQHNWPIIALPDDINYLTKLARPPPQQSIGEICPSSPSHLQNQPYYNDRTPTSNATSPTSSTHTNSQLSANPSIIKLAQLPLKTEERKEFFTVAYHLQGLPTSEQTEVQNLLSRQNCHTPFDYLIIDKTAQNPHEAVSVDNYASSPNNKQRQIISCYVQAHPLRIDLFCNTIRRFCKRIDQLQLMRHCSKQSFYHNIVPMSLFINILRSRLSCTKQFGFNVGTLPLTLLRYPMSMSKRHADKERQRQQQLLQQSHDNKAPLPGQSTYNPKDMDIEPLIHSQLDVAFCIPFLTPEKTRFNLFEHADPQLLKIISDPQLSKHTLFAQHVDPSQIGFWQQAHHSNPEVRFRASQHLSQLPPVSFERCLDDILLFHYQHQNSIANENLDHCEPSDEALSACQSHNYGSGPLILPPGIPTAAIPFSPIFPQMRYVCQQRFCAGIQFNVTRLLANTFTILHTSTAPIPTQHHLVHRLPEIRQYLHPFEDLLDLAHIDMGLPSKIVQHSLKQIRDKLSGNANSSPFFEDYNQCNGTGGHGPKNKEDISNLPNPLSKTQIRNGFSSDPHTLMLSTVEQTYPNSQQTPSMSTSPFGYKHAFFDTSGQFSFHLPFGVHPELDLCDGNQDCEGIKQLPSSLMQSNHIDAPYVCPSCTSWHLVENLVSRRGVVLCLFLDGRFTMIHATRNAFFPRESYNGTGEEDINTFYRSQFAKEIHRLNKDRLNLQSSAAAVFVGHEASNANINNSSAVLQSRSLLPNADYTSQHPKPYDSGHGGIISPPHFNSNYHNSAADMSPLQQNATTPGGLLTNSPSGSHALHRKKSGTDQSSACGSPNNSDKQNLLHGAQTQELSQRRTEADQERAMFERSSSRTSRGAPVVSTKNQFLDSQLERMQYLQGKRPGTHSVNLDGGEEIEDFTDADTFSHISQTSRTSTNSRPASMYDSHADQVLTPISSINNSLMQHMFASPMTAGIIDPFNSPIHLNLNDHSSSGNLFGSPMMQVQTGTFKSPYPPTPLQHSTSLQPSTCCAHTSIVCLGITTLQLQMPHIDQIAHMIQQLQKSLLSFGSLQLDQNGLYPQDSVINFLTQQLRTGIQNNMQHFCPQFSSNLQYLITNGVIPQQLNLTPTMEYIPLYERIRTAIHRMDYNYRVSTLGPALVEQNPSEFDQEALQSYPPNDPIGSNNNLIILSVVNDVVSLGQRARVLLDFLLQFQLKSNSQSLTKTPDGGFSQHLVPPPIIQMNPESKSPHHSTRRANRLLLSTGSNGTAEYPTSPHRLGQSGGSTSLIPYNPLLQGHQTITVASNAVNAAKTQFIVRQVLIARFGQTPCFWADWGEIVQKIKTQPGAGLAIISADDLFNVNGFMIRQRVSSSSTRYQGR